MYLRTTMKNSCHCQKLVFLNRAAAYPPVDRKLKRCAVNALPRGRLHSSPHSNSSLIIATLIKAHHMSRVAISLAIILSSGLIIATL